MWPRGYLILYKKLSIFPRLTAGAPLARGRGRLLPSLGLSSKVLSSIQQVAHSGICVNPRNEQLLSALGIDRLSFEQYVEWALTEDVVAFAVEGIGDISPYRDPPDALRRFRDYLLARTGRHWSDHDIDAIHSRVLGHFSAHHRKPLEYGEVLRLMWNVPHQCAKCGRKPPEVALHIDHIFPASKGGSSKFENLQFLCAKHNLQKRDKLEGGMPWLDLQ